MKRAVFFRRFLPGLALAAAVSTGLTWGDNGAQHRVQQAAPIKLGTSGSNSNDINSQYCCGGTLGSLVQDASGAKYILSNNHVLARVNGAAPGEAIYHRGYIDASCQPAVTVANLTTFVPINPSGNKVDAAIARIVTGQVSASGEILDIGVPGAQVREPASRLRVKKSGRTSGLTTGRIISTNSTVNVQYQQGCGIGPVFTAQFTDQFLISPGSFLQSGDSGSTVFENVSLNPRAVGLGFAGSSLYAVANRITNVLSAFGVSMVGAGSTAASQTLLTPPGQAQATAVEQRVEAAARAKARYAAFLSSLPDVVGHGVGLPENGPDEPVIQIFVEQATDRIRRVAPAALDGFRVEVLETGVFRAVPNCTACAACK